MARGTRPRGGGGYQGSGMEEVSGGRGYDGDGRGRGRGRGRGSYQGGGREEGSGGSGYEGDGRGRGHGRSSYQGGGREEGSGGGGYQGDGRGRGRGRSYQGGGREEGSGGVGYQGDGRGRGRGRGSYQGGGQEESSAGGRGYQGDARGRGRGRGDGRGRGKAHYNQNLDRNITDPSQSQPDPPCSEEDITPFWTELTVSSPGLVKRPDKVGEDFAHKIKLLANHFRIQFNNPLSAITRYKVGVKAVITSKKLDGKTVTSKEYLISLKDKLVQELYSNHSEHFPANSCSYDGDEYIFSLNMHHITEFNVNISETCDHIFSVKEVKQRELSMLRHYFSGRISDEDRDILFRGLNSLMKESSKKSMICVRGNFYKREPLGVLGSGAAVHTGFKQRLKLTSQGPALCLDYSAVPFYKKSSILSFLKETVDGFTGVGDLKICKEKVETVLDGLHVQATHKNKMKYTFVGLTSEATKDLDFTIEKPNAPSERTSVVDYFKKEHGLDIVHKEIPCLKLRRFRKSSDIYMPIELCELAEGQLYPNQQLEGVKETSVVPPEKRKQEISKIVSDPDGSFSDGVFFQNFGIRVNPHMTVIDGGLIDPPLLKLTKAGGRPSNVTVNKVRCDWNYSGNNFAKGQKLERWALVNLAPYDVTGTDFIKDLRARSGKLGMVMEQPTDFSYSTDDISSVEKIQKLVGDVIRYFKGRPIQIIIFIIIDKCKYYGYLKWVLETKIGVISQCCLLKAYRSPVVKKRDTFLDNLCMKINGKIGGSNVELEKGLPHFTDRDLVMFIGADVNHPAAKDRTSLSIAAVVGTVNWPAANRYVARIETQTHRSERIVNFGAMCKDLVNTFSQLNKAKPGKIVVFRDGVGEGQFDMVLSEELRDLKQAIFTHGYEPKITVVLAQKRHHTRIFGQEGGGEVENVHPGTVVETVIVHPTEFDFYLCSHYGVIGTNKTVHYHVLWDENKFPSHDLQKLIYHLCFTYAKCTKPVSLVPPVYYADRVATRGRMYYEAAKQESDAASSSSASSANPTPEDCCKLHPLVENTMFFI